jgi:lipopolysaccharide transport system permease protein
MNMQTLAIQQQTGPASPTPELTVIETSSGWRLIDWRELWRYRDLFYFLVWRDVKVRYAQSILGIGWAVLRPVFSMIVFTVIFGNLAKIASDGVPYAVFSYAALVPWTYFSSALTGASGSLVGASGMISKVYFPRLIIPLTTVLSNLVDFAIAMLILFGLIVWFGMQPTVWALLLPLLVLLMMLTAAGLGMWLTALAIQYRDVKYGLSFAVQLLMYATPVVYPASSVPQRYRLLYGLNPMTGVIESFRSALLSTNPMPWDLLLPGTIVAIIVFIGGALYFRRMERIFADVV